MGNEFSRRLVYLREHKRPVKTRSDTADFIGISRNALRKYELGITFPKIDTAALIAEYYGVTLDFLFYGKKCG